MRIRTHHDPKPIPLRGCDWEAWDDETYDGNPGQPLRSPYGDLHREYFGAKDYDHWVSQRCDCEYGMGPRHGHIVFAIGLRREVRGHDLTPTRREAAVYYLVHLEAIQASRAAP